MEGLGDVGRGVDVVGCRLLVLVGYCGVVFPVFVFLGLFRTFVLLVVHGVGVERECRWERIIRDRALAPLRSPSPGGTVAPVHAGPKLRWSKRGGVCVMLYVLVSQCLLVVRELN